MGTINKINVRDIRFPTSLEAHGSDAMVIRATLVNVRFQYRFYK